MVKTQACHPDAITFNEPNERGGHHPVIRIHVDPCVGAGFVFVEGIPFNGQCGTGRLIVGIAEIIDLKAS